VSKLLTPLQWSRPDRDAPPAAAPDSVPPADAAASASMFTWPTPPFATYPRSVEQQANEACEIVGLNGKRMHGRLIFFVPDEGMVHVQVPPARTTTALRFSQFKSLRVLPPLAPRQRPTASAPASGGAPHPAVLDQRPRTRYHVTLGAGGEMRGETIGHVETAQGLFLFPPLADDDSVQRLFVPREAYVDVQFGERIGDLLLKNTTATPQQIALAVAQQQEMRQQRIGDILVTRQLLTPEQLLEALDKQASMPMVRIGDALISLGLITQPQLDEALAQQTLDRNVPLGELLVRMGAVSRDDLQVALARKMGYPLVDLATFAVEADALRKLPFAVASRLGLMPLIVRDGRLIVALDDPARRRAALEEAEFVSQMKIAPVLAQCSAIEQILRAAYEKFGLAAGSGFAANSAAAHNNSFLKITFD